MLLRITTSSCFLVIIISSAQENIEFLSVGIANKYKKIPFFNSNFIGSNMSKVTEYSAYDN